MTTKVKHTRASPEVLNGRSKRRSRLKVKVKVNGHETFFITSTLAKLTKAEYMDELFTVKKVTK